MKNSKTQTQNKLFLITRNGLEELKVVKNTKMCVVAFRKNKNEYIYHTRTIANPTKNDFKVHGKITRIEK
tara:strand:+ start:326 stop:535 length:210 start_codon:yes stop_codon:yes gene_type:complete